MSTPCDHIRVAVALPVHDTYTYRVPEPLKSVVEIGKRVIVPFGNRRVTGYVTGPDESPDTEKIKAVLDVLDPAPLFPPSMMPFFHWIAGYYLYPIGEVIRTALPGGINPTGVAVYTASEAGQKALGKNFLTPMEQRILEQVIQKPTAHRQLIAALGKDLPHATLQAMVKQNWIRRESRLNPGKTRAKSERYVSLGPAAPDPDALTPAGEKILALLRSHEEISYKELRRQVPSTTRLAKPMASAGYLELFDKAVYRDPFGDVITPDTPLPFTAEQQCAHAAMTKEPDGGFRVYLLTGVTGSGKTEVYLQTAADVLQQGKTVLVLVPEIVLISQTERRFRARFGDKVAVLHSGLSAGERYDQWMRIARGRCPIVIGARSAVFAPLVNIGLVVVDEEHDSSYKQEGGLHYHGRDLAVMRAKQEGAAAVLGSATPSVESQFNTAGEKYIGLQLKHRVHHQPLPKIQVVDLRKFARHQGSLNFITPPLQAAIKETLKQKKQVLLFLNRRGYANYPVCSACGVAVRCRHCDITLTFHQHQNTFQCHYCGYTRPAQVRCTSCGAMAIKLLGLGTEKVETTIRGLFPSAVVARMDRDTTARRGDLLKILKGLRNGDVDVLVGTQMVAKGHDFPGITLVGVICADLSLNFPDFRSGERTFQLLAQVAGRAGRGDTPGKVVLQTYNPDHFSIHAAKSQDPETLYNREITLRKALKYPPFSRMVQLKIRGKDKAKTKQLAQELKSACLNIHQTDETYGRNIQIMGPIEAPLARIANHHRWQMLLKGANAKVIHRYMENLMFAHRDVFNQRFSSVTVDIDPVFLL
jgi:primosomal protein N' (replication factor Y) (superfamily II helicase)